MAVGQTDAVADTKMTKSSGEHWACSVLSQYGWGVALTRDGLERTDILAVHTTEPGRPMIEVQVKSLNFTGPKSSWPLGTKAQGPSQSDREWFVLVLLGKTPAERPRSFVVPRDHVAAARMDSTHGVAYRTRCSPWSAQCWPGSISRRGRCVPPVRRPLGSVARLGAQGPDSAAPSVLATRSGPQGWTALGPSLADQAASCLELRATTSADS